jgi:acyl carrier protein
MTPEDLRTTVLRALGTIAPEADLEHLQADVSLRDQLDIDSMDFLNFVIRLHKDLHVDIPEKDYPKLLTIRGCIEYLTTQSAKR